jgi:hypothetical protein
VIPANRQRNYFQAALYVAIVGILAAVLLERLLTYAEIAERAAMDATVSRLNAALYTRIAYLTLRGEADAIDGFRDRNPFSSAKMHVPNFIGEFDIAPPGDEAQGRWFYDRIRRQLVYVPNLKRYLRKGAGDADAALRYRLELHTSSERQYTGASMAPVGETRWTPAQ